jgi:hypothetical protein
MAGNRAVANLLRSPVDTEAPDGIAAASANALPQGTTTADAGHASVVRDTKLPGGWTDAAGKTISSGEVGAVDRILLDGLPGHQGRGWGDNTAASKGHVAAYGGGKAGQRGRAVALVPHGMKRGEGPLSIVVHLHGIDVAMYAASKQMRSTGARPEDVEKFQLPQQLEAFSANHPDARMIVIMPLGATVGGNGHGYTVDFGIDDYDEYIDSCLSKLGIKATGTSPGTAYLSAHSGGGFTVSALGSHPFHRYHFGGVFGFESFHGDEGEWEKIAIDHLEEDLQKLEALRSGGGADDRAILRSQLDYLEHEAFHFAAFGGSNSGYASRVRALRKRILKWFHDRRRRLQKATGGNPQLRELLWRNYQANYATEGHMESLSQDSHFESVLESLVAPPGAVSSTPAAPPAKTTAAPPAETKVTHADPVHSDHKEHTQDEHEKKPVVASSKKPATTKKAKGSSKKLRSVQEPFQFETWPLWEKPIELIHEFRGKGKSKKRLHNRAITATPSEFMPDLLKRAKVPNPDDFFKRFVGNLTFLGRPINAPIHEHLAEHLRDVEKDFGERFGGPSKDPKVAGDTLGLSNEAIAGARQVSGTAAISMHMFGLAIDVDHYKNPYLQAQGGLPSDVFKSIRQLMEGKSGGLDLGDSSEDLNKKYARISGFNQLVIDYFALADEANEDKLKAKLEHATGPWKKRDVKAAREAIQADLKSLGGHTQRGSDLPMLQQHGFLQLREEVVKGLKLNWGAWYGDMMHFDMRTDGDIGERVSKQIWKYLGELTAQADAPDPKK